MTRTMMIAATIALMTGAAHALVAFAASAQPVDPDWLRGDVDIHTGGGGFSSSPSGLAFLVFLGVILFGLPLLLYVCGLVAKVAMWSLVFLLLIGRSLTAGPAPAVMTTIAMLLFVTFALRPSTVWSGFVATVLDADRFMTGAK